MHARSTRLIVRAVAALTLGAATAPVSLTPVFADEVDFTVVTIADCTDPTLADQVAAAGEAAATAKKAFTDLRGPDSREVRQQRAEARAEAKAARKALRHTGHEGDRAAAKAARADLRAAQKTLRSSYEEAVKALKAERRATKAAWDETKEAFLALRDAAAGCVDGTDETDATDETEDPTV